MKKEEHIIRYSHERDTLNVAQCLGELIGGTLSAVIERDLTQTNSGQFYKQKISLSLNNLKRILASWVVE